MVAMCTNSRRDEISRNRTKKCQSFVFCNYSPPLPSIELFVCFCHTVAVAYVCC